MLQQALFRNAILYLQASALKQLSNGWARGGQVVVLGFFTLLFVGAAVLFYDSLEWDTVLWLTALLGFGGLSCKNALDFHDIYLDGNSTLVLQQLFYTKRLAAKDVQSVRSGLLPGSFYFVTAQRDFYFYLFSLQNLAKGIASLQTDITLQALKKKVRCMQQAT